jgi:hypothetical protein
MWLEGSRIGRARKGDQCYLACLKNAHFRGSLELTQRLIRRKRQNSFLLSGRLEKGGI